jgi:hypothetical protein
LAIYSVVVVLGGGFWLGLVATVSLDSWENIILIAAATEKEQNL